MKRSFAMATMSHLATACSTVGPVRWRSTERGPPDGNTQSRYGPALQSPFFGTALAIDGATVAVGAPYDEDGGQLTGAAYVYRRSGQRWSLEKKLVEADPRAASLFGFAVALEGDTLAVIGDRYERVYLFRRDNGRWTQIRQLRPNTPECARLAMDGEFLAVGCKGAIEVFRRGSGQWPRDATIRVNGNDRFGQGDLELHGSWLASASDDAVFVYQRARGRWARSKVIRRSNAGNFGSSISLSTQHIAIGAPSAEATMRGRVFVYGRSGSDWHQMLRLDPEEPEREMRFGDTIDLTGEELLVGAPGMFARRGGFFAVDLAAGDGCRCGAPGQCSSGFCVGGLCCDRACGGPCEACSIASRGKCQYRAESRVCRPANGVCDQAEYCTGRSGQRPTRDRRRPNGSTCPGGTCQAGICTPAPPPADAGVVPPPADTGTPAPADSSVAPADAQPADLRPPTDATVADGLFSDARPGDGSLVAQQGTSARDARPRANSQGEADAMTSTASGGGCSVPTDSAQAGIPWLLLCIVWLHRRRDNS